MDAFDADVLIYASVPKHHLGRRVRALFAEKPAQLAGIGSVLLLPEVLARPMREGATKEVAALAGLLGPLDLHPVDQVTAEVATALAGAYRLRATDAVHLSTAVVAGADRFITNNRRVFPASISEIDITYPETLAEL